MEITKKEKQKKGFWSLFEQSEIPLIVYLAVFVGVILTWTLRVYNPDLSLNLFSELLGAAFTLFVIDVLLVRSRTKRWKIVREHIDYLIARDVNRIRDGVANRAFSFDPNIESGLALEEQLIQIRDQRNSFLTHLEKQEQEEVISQINKKGLFSEEGYDYFQEKSEDIWNLLNMKYSEYMEPGLVSNLMELHTHLKDICGHIRQFQKADKFPEDRDYYYSIAIRGGGVSLKKILVILNDLKENGYSIAPSLSELEKKPLMN